MDQCACVALCQPQHTGHSFCYLASGLDALFYHLASSLELNLQPSALYQVHSVACSHAMHVGHVRALAQRFALQTDGLAVAFHSPSQNWVAVGLSSGQVCSWLKAKVVQYIVGSQDVAVLNLRNQYRERVACVDGLKLQALSHVALGNVVEHHAAHAAA